MSLINKLNTDQMHCLNQVVHLIRNKELDSAKQVVLLKKNDLGEKLVKNILSNLSSQEIINHMAHCQSECDNYKILLQKPLKIKNMQTSHKKLQFFNGEAPYEVLFRIFNFIENGKELLQLRLINKHVKNISFLSCSSPLWKLYFSYFHNGFDQVNNPLTYRKYLSLKENIKKNNYQFQHLKVQKIIECRRAWYGDIHAQNDMLAAIDKNASKIRIWDLTNQQIKHIISTNYSYQEACIKILDKYIYKSENKQITMWDLNKGKEQGSIMFQTKMDKIQTLTGHTKKIKDIQVSERNIYSIANDQAIKIFDRETGQIKQNFNIKGRSKPSRLIIEHSHIYTVAGANIFQWDQRSKESVFKRAHNAEFYSIEKDEEALYVGTNLGIIYSLDSRFSLMQQRFKTHYPTIISQFVLDGGYVFSQSLNSLDCTKDREVIEVFEKKSNKSIGLLKQDTSFFQFGAQESIQKIQMYKGILYTSSRYFHGDLLLSDLFGRVPSTIKTWNFNTSL